MGKRLLPEIWQEEQDYNSAKNYIATLKSLNMKAIAVVISEDRTMDVISTEDKEIECSAEDNNGQT